MSIAIEITGTPNGGWQNGGRCRDEFGGAYYADLFFEPDGRETATEREWRENAAKALCGGCPVRGDCLVDALETGDKWAIRGGFTVDERSVLSRANDQAPAPAKAA